MDYYIGEIRAVPFNFAPRDWAMCNGQLLSISQNSALFAILGTTYGGDGRTTFGLPNLQARILVGSGQGPGLSAYELGQSGGQAEVTLQPAHIPVHSHSRGAAATGNRPVGAVVPADGGAYASVPPGAAQPHPNQPPTLVVHFIIALVGVFPPRGS